MEAFENPKPTVGNVDCTSGKSSSSGFTLTELLVILAVIGVMSMLLLPAFAAPRSSNQAVQCMHNKRQLMRATQMYAANNGDLLPPNPDDANSSLGHYWVPGNATGSGAGGNWTSAAFLNDERRFLLLPYVKTISVLKCPADHRFGKFQDGTTGPSLRTVSMNGTVGTACASWENGGGHRGRPELETRASYLTGTPNDPQYNRYNKLSAIAQPRPARLWVFLDESPLILNDGAFGVSMRDLVWYDVPGAYHNRAGCFSFADGHVELHRWKSAQTGNRIDAITPAHG